MVLMINAHGSAQFFAEQKFPVIDWLANQNAFPRLGIGSIKVSLILKDTAVQGCPKNAS